jgi:hypothetical protein
VNTPLADDAPVVHWKFPPPIGIQVVVGEFTTADSLTIPRHLRTREIRTYMTLAPLKDLDDPDLSPPPAIDRTGRSAQTFLVEVVVRAGSEERRAVATWKVSKVIGTGRPDRCVDWERTQSARGLALMKETLRALSRFDSDPSSASLHPRVPIADIWVLETLIDTKGQSRETPEKTEWSSNLVRREFGRTFSRTDRRVPCGLAATLL